LLDFLAKKQKHVEMVLTLNVVVFIKEIPFLYQLYNENLYLIEDVQPVQKNQ